ncbi:thiamine pyrophosphate-binding protein [Patescibacteria group bacterium]|nr:thiamine pyrophosphate-binding protein [Patescibacteria group bacterium]MBU1931918.1 thiamine pyrophosphate-binding protein [Patescibacteria group bacterium]
MTNKKIRVADFVSRFISDFGVKHVCLLTGGGMMHLSDGLALNKKIKPVCFHHEQGAAMALEAYARTTGHLGVGYFTTGPGAINALTGTAGAYLDSTPCLYISAQAKCREATYALGIPGLRQCGVQEFNIMPMAKTVTKYAAFINDPNEIRFQLEKAVYIAKSGRPGPVWLDIPLDVQGAYIDPKKLRRFIPPKEKQEINSITMKKFISAFKSASRPVILAGYGVRISGAIKSLDKLAKKYQIPIVTTLLSVDIIEENHPEYVGRIGIKGTRAGNLAIQNSDLLIVIGSSLPVAEIGFEYHLFAREAKIIVVDIETCSHKKKTIKIDQLIKADADNFIKKTLSLLKNKKIGFDKNWLKTCIQWKKKYPVCLPKYKKTKKYINYYYFVDRLSQQLKASDIMVTDAGSALYVGFQAVKIKKGMRYITSGGFGTMGYSLPAGIGVSLATGNKRVICINGDGSFQQNIQELQTVVHYKLPIKIFVINNDGYLSIRFTQKKFFGRLIGESPSSGVSFPDTAKIARAYGIKYFRAAENSQLNKALSKTLNYPGPVICEIVTPKNQLIIPSVASVKRKDGTMISKPLEDMFPFLPRKEFLKNMFVKPVEEKNEKPTNQGH